MKRSTVSNNEAYPLLCAAIQVQAEDRVSVVAMGEGCYRKTNAIGWTSLNQGLPEGVVIHRLVDDQGTLLACTNQGLFVLDERLEHEPAWRATSFTLPCYQFKRIDGQGWLAAQGGVWIGSASLTHWGEPERTFGVCYDFVCTVQYLFYAHELGVTMYDRYTDEWHSFGPVVDRAVTCLVVGTGRLFGATADGAFVESSRAGELNVVSFGHLSVSGVKKLGQYVFVMTQRGLYQVRNWDGQIVLFAIYSGGAVMDVDQCGDKLYLATTFDGVQVVEWGDRYF